MSYKEYRSSKKVLERIKSIALLFLLCISVFALGRTVAKGIQNLPNTSPADGFYMTVNSSGAPTARLTRQ